MPKASVAAIITSIDSNGNTKVLLTQRNIAPFKDKWCLPGGHIDMNETAQDAIIREVKEEIGLDFNPRFFSSFDEIFPDKEFHAVVSVFEGTASGKLKAQKAEVKDIQWFDLNEARLFDLAFEHKKILDTYANQKTSSELMNQVFQEYTALRNDILKRTELRTQLLTFTLVIAGTFLSLGAQQLVKAPVLLVYPILATFLAVTWSQLDIRIGEIGEYIRTNIESQLPGMRWEQYMRNKYASGKNPLRKKLVSFSAGGIFLGTQILTVAIAIYLKLSFSVTEIILLFASALGVLATIFLILIRRRSYKESG